jgi:alpha-glucuronidase
MRLHLSRLLLLVILLARVHAEPARLALGGEAKMAIVTSKAASPLVKAAAADLQRLPRQITGANFAVETGSGQRGVVLGIAMDFPAIPVPVSFRGGPFGREEYILRSHSDALYLIGATDLAVQNAVWDLLYRLGYRQFFPGQT